jgi:hypothetical protein
MPSTSLFAMQNNNLCPVQDINPAHEAIRGTQGAINRPFCLFPTVSIENRVTN